MGWFSRACSFVGNAVSAVASAASTAFNKAREVAGRALDWVAEKAENFVGTVKKVWNVVSPHVQTIRTALKAAAIAVPIPWVKGALLAIEKGLGALTAFENSPIAKKVEQAIKWSIEMAKRWKGAKEKEVEVESERLSEDQMAEARRHQETFRLVEREALDPETQKAVELAAAINDYEIATADLERTIASAPSEFDHYLRLRATQKLLAGSDRTFRKAQSIDDIGADDLFLVKIASDLIKPDPKLSQEAAQRLDRILKGKIGKTLQSFVFEEIIASWVKRADALESEWEFASKAYAKDKMLLRRLEIAEKIQDSLTDDERKQLDELRGSDAEKKLQLDELAAEESSLRAYVGAAEGFLQTLEKSDAQIVAEDRAYLLADGASVGKLLMRVAEQNIKFTDLEEDDREMIIAYSNIFRQESHQRMHAVLEVAA